MIRNQFDYLADCECLQTRCASVYCASPIFVTSLVFTVTSKVIIFMYFHRFGLLLKLFIAGHAILTYTQGRHNVHFNDWRCRLSTTAVSLSYRWHFRSLTLKRILAGIRPMRFRTVMPCVSVYFFLRFRKVYCCVFMTFLNWCVAFSEYSPPKMACGCALKLLINFANGTLNNMTVGIIPHVQHVALKPHA